MVIDKIINNNIVSAFDEKGLEVVIMGRGIGFQMKRGQEVPAEKIEKVFRIKSQSIAEQLKELLAKMPLEQVLEGHGAAWQTRSRPPVRNIEHGRANSL